MINTISLILFMIFMFVPVDGLPIENNKMKSNNESGTIIKQDVLVSKVRPVNKRWHNVCNYFNKYQSIKYRDVLEKMNVEQMLTDEICYVKGKWNCGDNSIDYKAFHGMGVRKDDMKFNDLIGSGMRVEASLVDIDNDGVKELRLWSYSGTASCMSNYFWK